MVKRKPDEVSQKESQPERKGKKAPPRKVKQDLPKVVVGKPKDKQGKKEKRKTRQERAGLHISPNRCRRIFGRTWNGGKIGKEANVVMAALLQYFAQTALQGALRIAGNRPATCSDLQRSITEMQWPAESGLLKMHIMGAALGQGEADNDDNDEAGDE
jgi:hypothetical protein